VRESGGTKGSSDGDGDDLLEHGDFLELMGVLVRSAVLSDSVVSLRPCYHQRGD
jgi:hypothetical protein